MNIPLLQPVFTIQSYTGLKVKNILSRFLPATKWKKVVANTMFFAHICWSQFAALNYLQLKETILSSFFELHSKSSRRVHGTRLECFALFLTHDYESET